MLKGLIFDCDGVMVDTELLFAKGSMEHLSRYGIHDDGLLDSEFAGYTAVEYCRIIIERYHIPETLETFYAEEKKYYEKQFEAGVPVMSGFKDFVVMLKKRGIKLGVASSSSRDYVLDKLRLCGVEGQFDVMVNGENVKRSKPAPDIYLLVIEKMELPADQMLVIEDSTAGIKAAKSAGLKVIGYKGSKLKQDTSEADLEVNRYQDLSFDELATLCS